MKYGVIDADLVKHWAEESDPIYELTTEDEANEIYPKITKRRVFHASGYEGYEINGVIVLTNSPYYTYGRTCRLFQNCFYMNGYDENNKCYCFGPEWYDPYRIPHYIYDLLTNETVYHSKWLEK